MIRGFLLDTNVVSELIRSQPEPRVQSWIAAQDDVLLYLSVVTVGELHKGLGLLPPSERWKKLEHWLRQDLTPRFRGRILPVTHAIAERWGALEARCHLNGVGLSTADGMIAATALEHDLTVVTRDASFTRLGVMVLNPWETP